MLVQALLGAISPNFRRVALAFSEPTLELLFILEKESPTDREEIEDVVGEFDSLLLGLNTRYIKYSVSVAVSAEYFPTLDNSVWRVVYFRREI